MSNIINRSEQFILPDCGNVTIANGIATVNNGTTVTNSATITCNCGYKLNGEDTLTCTTTGWDKAFPTCSGIITCFKN